MTGNNFALELTVGIEDLFTKEQQRIERSAKSLETQFEHLQKTAGDVTEYRRMKEGLEQIGKEAGTTSREFQEQERQLQKYAESLRRAEVNVSKLTQEQRRLNEQLHEMKQASQGVQSLSADLADMAGSLAGIAVASSSIAGGANVITMEKKAALRTGKGADFFSSAAERTWRHQTMRKTGATEGDAMDARILAGKLGVGDIEARSIAEQALGLQRANPDWDVNEITRALFAARQGFGAEAGISADLLYRISTEGGDRSGDLLDTFNEYSTLMKDAGLSIQQFSAMLLSGAQSGAFNYDKIADGLKESIKARLTDVGEMETLLGVGKKPGEIDTLIKDEKMRGALKSAVGQFRQANETGGDVGPAFTKILTLVTGLYQTDPGAAKNIMERVFGVQFAEDMGEKVIQGITKGAANPEAILGDYQGKLDKGLMESFSSMERLSTSWDVTVGKFNEAVGDFIEGLSPFTDLLTKMVDKAGSFIEENPNTAVAGSAALVVGAVAGKRLIFNKIKGWLKGGMGGPGSMADGVPEWMMSREGSPNSTKGGGWKRLSKGLGPLGILLGGVQMLDAAQSGDSDQLAVTTAGVGGGALGAYGGAALGTMVFPGVGTAVGGVFGGILGSILGEEGMQALVDWFDGGKADQEMERLLPPPSITKPTETGTTPSPPPAIALSQQLAITISPDFTNTADMETAIVQAMRNSTPELMQEFQAVLERVMQGMDYAQGSS